MSTFSRRQFLLTAAGGTAGAIWLSACGGQKKTSETPATGGSGDVEVSGATLGFIALTDAAPLIIALEKGFFAKHGVPDTKVVKQTSWAVTRDNLELGSERGGIDGAHILSPMPLLLAAGKITKSKQPLPMATLARLNLQGQGLSASKELLPEKLAIDNAAGLKKALASTGAKGRKFKAAVTFPGGTHDLWMRYWLAANGIDPNKDADLVVIPPPQMVANMQTGTMDVFCVGEPWNERLVNKQLGYTAATTGELWKAHPE
jgi:nitrate/nitrite transport system substrate-binding protein